MGDGATDRIARALLALLGTGRQRADVTVPDMAAAGRVTARVRTLREERGERVVGRKIGFTNTTIWAAYGVDGPMWNYVWDATLHHADSGAATVGLAGLPEPRIEPEVVLHLGSAPEPGMDEAALLGCVDRVAHGCEIVQSVFPGWKFTGADSAAAFGLHGALVVGPWHDVAAERAGWGARLADFGVTLCRGGAAIDTGHARNVLGGPLSALRYLVETIAGDPEGAQLQAGEIVTTGTLTDAHPVSPGEAWSTEFDGIGFEGLRLSFRS
jgi:2-oxo-3-hexenedioate decarboxylase